MDSRTDEEGLNTYLKKLCSDVTLQSEKEGFFGEWVSLVVDSLPKEFLSQFGTSRNDRQRVSAVWGQKVKYEAVHSTLNVQRHFTGKNGDVSEEKRRAGNQAYRDKENETALALYTQAVIRAPLTGETLSLATANRSAVLFQKEEFSWCLRDIELAFTYNYPRRLLHKMMLPNPRYQKPKGEEPPKNFTKETKKSAKSKSWFCNTCRKLLDRRGDCFMRMGRHEDAKLSFVAASKSLEESTLDSERREALAGQLESKVQKCGQYKKANKSRSAQNEFTFREELYKGASKVLPNASSVLGLRSSEEAGRFIVSEGPIPTGKCLVRENPFCSVLKTEKRGVFCEHCFARLVAAVPCETCSGVAYCSTQCRETANLTYHKWECPFGGLFRASGMSLNCALSLRVVTERGLQYFREVASDMSEGGRRTSLPTEQNPLRGQRGQSYKTFFHLAALESLRDPWDYLQRTFMAIFLLKVLQCAGFFTTATKEGEELTEDELLIGSLLLRHLQVIQFNAHEVSGMWYEDEMAFRKCKSVYLGLAVYPTVSFFNHSCYPSVGRYFHGKEMTIVSLRPLRAGEMIPENYGPVFTHQTLQERRRKLLSRYWFRCGCEACEGDWPTYSDMRADILLRLEDGRREERENERRRKRRNKKGKKMLNREEKMAQIQCAHEDYEKAISLMDRNLREDAISMYCRWVDKATPRVQLPLKDVHLAIQALRLLVAARGSHFLTTSKK